MRWSGPAANSETGARYARTLGVGAVLLLLAICSWFLHVSAAAQAEHAWDSSTPRGATSSTSAADVRLRIGRLYYLSTPGGIVEASAATSGSDSFACTYSGSAGQDIFLSVTKVSLDPAIRHRIASFLAPENGPISISCADVGPVFVDDAGNAAFDRSGMFVLLTVVLGLAGGLCALAGLMRRDVGPTPVAR